MKFQSIWAAFSGGLVAFCLVISVAMAQIPTVWNNCPERGYVQS